MNVAGLMHGAHKSHNVAKHLAQIDVLLATMQMLPFDDPAARYFGSLKAMLEKACIPLAWADLQIAAIALRHQVPLVTHNQRHFSRVAALELEDWLA